MARLEQVANIAEIDKFGVGEWTTLYEFRSQEHGSECIYSALLALDRVPDALSHVSWDAMIGHGMPGFTQSYDDQRVVTTTYHRFGSNGVEPIVYSREFHGLKPNQFDLSEEFRHFHNLYHDRQNNRYIHIDDRGKEAIAAEIAAGSCRVLTRLLRQYMAARQLSLAIFFDHNTRAEVDEAAAKEAFPTREIAETDRRYRVSVGSFAGGEVISRLVGKKIIPAPPIEQSGVWPFEANSHTQFAEFVIGVTEDGEPLLHNCNPDSLANYFGANEHAPHYLTPVWFTRNVLAKYYENSDKYSVEDGYLRCGSLWGMQIDNNLADHVVAYLGDLGRDLDYAEQQYWKHFNVTPGNRKPSETNFKRSFLAQFTDPSAPDLVFRQRYAALQETWTQRFGWPLFRALHPADAHILQQFRVPLTQALGEFETQILYLVKLLVDSLNDSELAKACGGALPNEQSIAKFTRYLEQTGYPHKDRDIELLRLLQRLRSTGAVHAKGGNFEKVQEEVGLHNTPPPDVFRGLLARANQMLADLSAHFVPEV